MFLVNMVTLVQGIGKWPLHVQFAASDIGTHHLQETTWVIGVVEAHTFVVQLQVC